MKILIVGGVAAGASAAARARRLDEDAEILILERGRFVSFANCGLPYYLGGDIKRRKDLLIATPRTFRENFNIEVRTGHEAVAIDRKSRKVTVMDIEAGSRYEERYDKLILSQGAAPVRPDLPGAGHPRIFTLRNIPDMDDVKELIDGGASTAVILGAGYIGLEAAEALIHQGVQVDLMELQDQVLPTLDREMANDLAFHLLKKGVRLHLGASAASFEDAAGRVEVRLRDGRKISADLVLLAIGVRPETGLAKKAGLSIGERGGISVDKHMRTSDPDIYAAGDMVEVMETVSGEPALLPLAGPANRQGRIVADHIFGRRSSYTSTQGTAIVKVFDMTAAMTGAAERALRRMGRLYQKMYLWPFGHASYYPGTDQMHMKVLFAPDDGRILGAQIVGFDGVDKRIDIFAAAVRCGMTVFDLEHLELAYAPPYGSAKDPVNMAGFVGANILNGDVRFWFADEHPRRTSEGTLVDVRSVKEFAAGHIEGAVNIPLDEARKRIDELALLRKPLFIYCLTGIRSYFVYRILTSRGIDEIYNLAGGWRTFESFFRTRLENGSTGVLHSSRTE